MLLVKLILIDFIVILIDNIRCVLYKPFTSVLQGLPLTLWMVKGGAGRLANGTYGRTNNIQGG